MRRLAVLVSLLLLPLVASASTVPATVRGPGYTLRAFKWHGSQVRVLTVTGGNGFEVVDRWARPCFSMNPDTPASITARTGGVAAVDEDFIGVPGAPQHVVMIDGELWTSGTGVARPFKVPRNYSLSCTGGGPQLPPTHHRTPRRHPGGRGTGEPGYDAMFMATRGDAQAWILPYSPHTVLRTWLNDTRLIHPVRVVSWNGTQPFGRNLVAFTRRGGGIVFPYYRSCFARIRHRKVVSIRGMRHCNAPPLQVHRAGDIVLAGRPVRELKVGDHIRFTNEWPRAGIRNVFGGRPMLVRNGLNVVHSVGVSRSLYLFYHPRTGIGISRGCTNGGTCQVFLVTVDGRQPGWSAGQQMFEWASLFQALGAWDAFNLDGGGSTVMWTRRRSALCSSFTPVRVGCVVNRPSNGGNGLDSQHQAHVIRPVMSAIGIYREGAK